MTEDDEPGGGPAFEALGGAAEAVRRHWDDLVDDMAVTADEYRAAGWDVLELHPGDVTALVESATLDVLVPDDEFEQLREWTESGTFTEHEVYRAASGLVFLLVVLKDPDADRAVCCPAYYDESAVEQLRERARARGGMRTHVRRLSEESVTFTHGTPEPFFPDSTDGE
jgi:hypothetical protein